MPEKEPGNYSLITYAWVVFLSMWGGAVGFLNRYKEGVVRPLNFTELLGEFVTSGFIGLITFWLCEWSSTPPLLAAPMIGISGHMGSRAIFQLERWFIARHPMKE